MTTMEPPKPAPVSNWFTTHLRSVRTGPDSITQLQDVMSDILPAETAAKAMVITGKSLSTKTPVVKKVEELLKDAHKATYTGIRQHTPIADIEEALDLIRKNEINILIGLGGGSPIDACKTLSYFHNERFGSYLLHIAVPTTLSAAEFTQLAGHTDKDGNKTGVFAEEICPKAVILDPLFAQYTPLKLWLSTGIRALDHALECLYRPGGQYPVQQLALCAARDLFTYLPKCSDAQGEDIDARGHLQVAAWMSLYPTRLDTALGPSHALGHALGARYSIPHGTCSVLTLPGTIRTMARTLPSESIQQTMLANVFSFLPTSFVRDHLNLNESEEGDEGTSVCLAVAGALDKLIEKLDLKTSLSEYSVPKEDLPKIAAAAYEATASKPGWKDLCPSEEEMVKEILEPIY